MSLQHFADFSCVWRLSPIQFYPISVLENSIIQNMMILLSVARFQTLALYDA